MTTKDHVREIVFASLKEIIEQGGYEMPAEVDDATNPIKDLDLDSMMGVSFACAVSDRGIAVPDEDNPFVDDKRGSARTIGEIVDHIFALAAKKKELPAHG